MLFLVHTWDRPGALDVRLAHRDDHIAWLKASGSRIKAAGPWLNEAEEMAGSLLIVEATDRTELDTWLDGDPYRAAGLFDRIEIAPYRWVFNPPAGTAS
ncbi:YciI family protein [Maricaulis sp.]|uniref:YciI family protein n=1 Tax=Maricaulis sp. TaxID=1486257 RepID=UPI002611D14F|nr:YciI family protein [Maricaulis sp.]